MHMNPRFHQTCAAVLGVTGAYVGAWALFLPHVFYTSFPGFGRHWVDTLGQYNEHLARDVGGLYCAMALMSLWAATRPSRDRLSLLGLGWLVFNVPHALFHLDHLDVYKAADQIGNVVLLLGVTILAGLLLIPVRGGTTTTT